MPNTLFSQSYLEAGLKETDEYRQVSPQQLSYFGQDLRKPYADFTRAYRASNEAQIEDALIRPVLSALGWTYLPQQPIPVSGLRPDYMLFADADARAAFTAGGSDTSVYPLAPAEAKAWETDLDRRAGRPLSPSAQVQDYLRQFWLSTSGRVKWGILTNGETWRLYRATGTGPDGKFHQTQDVWFELKLSECVSDAGKEQRRQFLLFFHRDAFLVGDDGFCFLDRALSGANDYVQNVVDTLTDTVFEEVYPQLLRAFYQAAPQAAPEEIQESSLFLLYRLLFLMYAEDRRLLPTEHPAYSTISLRSLRREILARLESNPVFLNTYTYWPRLQELFARIDAGEPLAGLPAYNGGLFDRERPELLARARLSDDSVATIINSLGAAAVNGSPERTLVNFRDLSVEQLGTLYERLLEWRPVIREGQVSAQLQPHARKDTGSYYTPPELVRFIVEQTLEPLVAEREEQFRELAVSLVPDTHDTDNRDFEARRRELTAADPAAAVLQLKALDPAMGSGHFLVAALDYLTVEIDRLAGLGAEVAGWLPDDAPYVSPLETRIANIRGEILGQSAAGGWELDPDSLTDRAIIRRLVLKRCIYGVDLNPLAVELAKMSLWLHSFTVGAPLTFLDHHLRCGDSLVGGWLAQTADDIRTAGGGFANYVFARMTAAARSIHAIEQIDDSDVAEVRESASLFRSMEESVTPARRILNFFAGLRWMAAGANNRPLALRHPRQLRRQIGDDHATAVAWWLGQDFDTQLRLLEHGASVLTEEDRQADGFDYAGFARFFALWRVVEELAEERRMLHWELTFPGVFDDWIPRSGGFDAVIGNPPWEVVKLEEVRWFQSRRADIASATPASHRRDLIAQLESDNDPLYHDYADALAQANTMRQYGRTSGDYPLLSSGDTNLYWLFMERANALGNPNSVIALLTPSGIYADRSVARFFRSIVEASRLLALYDFQNSRGLGREAFFPDVHRSYKFCTMIIGGTSRTAEEVPCGFLLNDLPNDTDAERLLTIRATDFALVNPSTGTVPIFLNRRDADIALDIYRNHPVLGSENRALESLNAISRFAMVAHMTNDSSEFRTAEQLVSEGYYPVGLNRYRMGAQEMLPLFQSRMIHQYDHRLNSVGFNPNNAQNRYVSVPITDEQHRNPLFYSMPYYWIHQDFVRGKFSDTPAYAIGFRNNARTQDERTLISTVVPWAGYGHSLPIMIADSAEVVDVFNDIAPLWAANFSSFIMDFVVKRKLQGANISYYILDQLPVITRAAYDRQIGDTTAADLARDHVLRLCYTAYDLQPFAASQLPLLPSNDYDGEPYGWDVEQRRHLRARLDALYFILYGLDRDAAAYVMDSFPITRRNDHRAHGRYLTKDLILAYISALEAGDTETVIIL